MKPRYAPEITNHPQRIKKDLARIVDIITVLDDEVRDGLNGLELIGNLFQRLCAEKLKEETNGTMESIDMWKVSSSIGCGFMSCDTHPLPI
jgi:head-tail adaptor